MAKPYFPTNGTEGTAFIAHWCKNCKAFNICIILTRSFAGVEPRQWIRRKDELPTCTSFRDKNEPNKKKIRANRRQGELLNVHRH